MAEDLGPADFRAADAAAASAALQAEAVRVALAAAAAVEGSTVVEAPTAAGPDGGNIKICARRYVLYLRAFVL